MQNLQISIRANSILAWEFMILKAEQTKRQLLAICHCFVRLWRNQSSTRLIYCYQIFKCNRKSWNDRGDWIYLSSDGKDRRKKVKYAMLCNEKRIYFKKDQEIEKEYEKKGQASTSYVMSP